MTCQSQITDWRYKRGEKNSTIVRGETEWRSFNDEGLGGLIVVGAWAKRKGWKKNYYNEKGTSRSCAGWKTQTSMQSMDLLTRREKKKRQPLFLFVIDNGPDNGNQFFFCTLLSLSFRRSLQKITSPVYRGDP